MSSVCVCVCACREERRQGKNCCGQMKYLTAYLLVFPLLYESDLMLSYSCSEIVQLSLKCLKTHTYCILFCSVTSLNILLFSLILDTISRELFIVFPDKIIHHVCRYDDNKCIQCVSITVLGFVSDQSLYI